MLWKIFIAAVAIRWVYALSQFVVMGGAGLQEPDSVGYLAGAHELAQAITDGSLHGAQWLGFSTVTMPLYAWFIGLHALAFGKMVVLASVFTQGVLDAGTCLLIHSIAKTLNPRIAIPAAIMATLNPTQIILSALVLTDTIFLFFSALFLLAAVRWLRAPSWRWAVILGISLGCAAMVRIVVVPWAVFLVLFLLVVAAARSQFSARVVGQLMLVSAIFALSLAPVLWRNVSHYGSWSLTSQGGIHLAYWIVPLVKEARDGTVWAVGREEMEKAVRTRFPTATDNPFEQSRRYQVLAREELAKLDFASFAKAWIFGAAMNLAAPAITLSQVVASLPRTGFYATKATSLPDKAFNFLFHSDNAIYAWVVLISIVGLVVIRLIQLVGLWTLIGRESNWPILAMFFFWVSFILAVSGPIASPKYRLPIEPVLMVLAGAGFQRLGFWSRKEA
jgi:4-amino-4-deoxy-L-arabinose transferase-like glycosyltransferase